MPDSPQTIAVIGSTPFAGLLACLLAKHHSKEVVLVSKRFNVHRVPTSLSMPIAPVLRLDTWRQVQSGWNEARQAILDVAPNAISRTDATYAAAGHEAQTALSHFRHLVTGFRLVSEPLAPAPGNAARAICIRDIDRIHATPLMGAMEVALQSVGVKRIDPDGARLTIKRDGSGRLDDLVLDKVVLADDEALIAHIQPHILEELGVVCPMRAVLSEPAPRLPFSMIERLDLGVTIIQRETGEVWAAAPRDGSGFDVAVPATLADVPALRSAARIDFSRFCSHDGAPLVGPLRQTRATALTGLGALDLALAPMLARYLAGVASSEEMDWCVARRPTRSMDTYAVAEFIAPAQSRAA